MTSMANATSDIQLNALTVRRGGRVVFENLTASVAAGEVLILKGHNGSGKSTLLRCLAGFIPLSAGALLVNGTSVKDDPSISRYQMALSGHLNGMKTAMTLRQNLEHYKGITNGCGNVEEAAKAFQLDALLDDELRYYSQGQQHRAGLAKLLVSGRNIWLMDEPTVGLDASNRDTLKAVMQSHIASGGLIIAATHEDLGIEGKTLDLSDFQPTTNHNEWLEGDAA